MRNWSALKERYLKDKIPLRLGNLASNLSRIKSRCISGSDRQVVEGLLQESKFFIEWTAADTEVELAAELVELQVMLARWQYNLVGIWDNIELRTEVSQVADVWSGKLLRKSGLLDGV